MGYRTHCIRFLALLLLLMVSDRPALGFDTELNRSTLAGLPGVNGARNVLAAVQEIGSYVNDEGSRALGPELGRQVLRLD